MKITENFTLEELSHSNTAKSRNIENIPGEVEIENLKELAENVLQPLRDLVNVPIIVSSGFRNDVVNKLVGGVPGSQHRKGQAADINAKNKNARDLFNTIIESSIPYDQVILYDDGRNNFVHISYNKAGNRKQKLYSKGTKQ